MLPIRADGHCAAIWTASGKSFASIRKNPPICSLVSANGPSVTSSSPSRTRTIDAVVALCSACVTIKRPLFRSLRQQAEDRQADQERARRRPRAESERDGKGVALGRREALGELEDR